eukprot:3926161-Rhodomonas_salina.2
MRGVLPASSSAAACDRQRLTETNRIKEAKVKPVSLSLSLSISPCLSLSVSLCLSPTRLKTTLWTLTSWTWDRFYRLEAEARTGSRCQHGNEHPSWAGPALRARKPHRHWL